MRSMILSAVAAGLAAGVGGLAADAAAASSAAAGEALRVAQGLDNPAPEVQAKRDAVARELKQMSETMAELASKRIGENADPMMARRIEQEQANLSVLATKLRSEADKLAYPSTSRAEARNELEQALEKVESIQQSVSDRRAMAEEAIRQSGGENSPLYKLLSSAVETLSKERVQSLREKL